MNQTNNLYSLIAVGLGPANLSLSALLHHLPDYKSMFLEKTPKFRWHPYMLFDFSKINVGCHKDLVSLVDPTNPFSFLNYLVQNNMQYEFFNAAFKQVSRHEFERYYQWVAKHLPNLAFDCPVDAIHYDSKQDRFSVLSKSHEYFARNVVIGTGIKAKMPKWFSSTQHNDAVLHCYDYLKKVRNFRDQNVLIAGGGQSAAEILYSLLLDTTKLPKKIYWISNKGYPVTLDENPFANEIYTPTFSHAFYDLDAGNRVHLNRVLKNTSDGIHETLLNKIYQRLFELRYTYNTPIELIFTPLSKLVRLDKRNSKYCASIQGLVKKEIADLDAIIFCTGYAYNSEDFLSGFSNYYGQTLQINKDFSIKPLNKNSRCKIFLNNGAKAFYGPADPNLSLISWRNAIIINSILKRPVYNMSEKDNVISWSFENTISSLEVKNTLELVNEY